MSNDSSPRISIVLPTYNRANYIVETIESVRKQVFRDWELLIIDDSSQDDTEQLVREINDERIKLFISPIRVGITATRAEGVTRSKGELIAFIDSDDLWDETKLAKQVVAFDQYPDAGFCLTGGYNFKKNVEPVEYYYKQRDGMKYGDLLIPFFKSEIAALTPSLVFKRTCFEKIEFSPHVKLIMQLARYYKGIILYEPLLFRRLHDSNTSVLEWENREKEGIRLLLDYCQFVPEKVAKDTLFRTYLNSGEHYLSHGRKKQAVRQFINAIRQRPFTIIPLKKIVKAVLYRSERK